MAEQANRGITPSAKRQTEAAKNCEIWLCLRFTHLAMNSAGIRFNTKQAAAINEQQQVWQCNESALKSAIVPGISVNHALMLNPEIQIQERDLQLETQKLRELSHWAYRFTSMVSVYNDHSLLLEVGKSTKLFKSLKQLINLINNDLTSFGIDVALGMAETPKAAYVLSFCRQGRSELFSPEKLQCAALEYLDIDARTIDKLHNCGFDTLADIQSVPQSELGARFGQEFVHYLDQLWGNTPDPQIGTTPPETFHACVDFAEPIRNLNWIQQQLDRLLGDLEQFITIRQLVCRSFTWRFYHENNRLLKTVKIGLSAKQNTLAVFKELTELKLADTQLDWEFSSIELSASQLVPRQLFSNDLFDPRPDQEQFRQLIDKLTNRLGHTALFRVCAEPEHLPELANGRQHASAPLDKELPMVAAAPARQLKDEPLWLLENPRRLSQQQQQPLLEGPLNLIHGPNRISSHWWAKLQSRDYFIARQRNGRLLWIFFDRNRREWFLHGLFA